MWMQGLSYEYNSAPTGINSTATGPPYSATDLRENLPTRHFRPLQKVGSANFGLEFVFIEILRIFWPKMASFYRNTKELINES